MYPVNHWLFANQADRSVYITREPGIVYFSVPKCACSTIKIFLRVIAGESLDSVTAMPHLYPLPSDFWIPFSELGSTGRLKEFVSSNKAYAFSVVRDPRDRILSAYLDKFGERSSDENVLVFGRQLLSYQGTNCDDEILANCKNMSFLEFLNHINRSSSHAAMNEHWRPYANQLLGLHKESDFNLKLFDMNDTSSLFREISELYPGRQHPGLDFKFAPHQTNASTRRNLCYGNTEMDAFEKTYAEDLELYYNVLKKQEN